MKFILLPIFVLSLSSCLSGSMDNVKVNAGELKTCTVSKVQLEMVKEGLATSAEVSEAARVEGDNDVKRDYLDSNINSLHVTQGSLADILRDCEG